MGCSSSSVSEVPLSHLWVAFLEDYHPNFYVARELEPRGRLDVGSCGIQWTTLSSQRRAPPWWWSAQAPDAGPLSQALLDTRPDLWAVIPWPWLPEATPSQVSDLQHLSLHLTDRILAFFVAGLALSWQTDLVLYPEALFIYKFRDSLNFLPPGSYKSRPLWHANCGNLGKIQNG